MRKSAIAALAALFVILFSLTALGQDERTRTASLDRSTTAYATNGEGIETRVVVSEGNQAVGVVNGDDVLLTSNENLSVVWMGRNLHCSGGQPSNSGDFKIPGEAILSCRTESSGVMAGITEVVAKVPAPLSSRDYKFELTGCNTCTRNLDVTVDATYLTTDSGYTRDEVDERVEEAGDGANCCDLLAGYAMYPDASDATASMGHGVRIQFQARPLDMLGLGVQYMYTTQTVWLNPYYSDAFTDDDHPEHLHSILGRVVFSGPVIREGKSRDWLRLEIGGLIGGSLWHYETYQFDQLDNMRMVAQNNRDVGTFDLGGTAGIKFFPFKHFLIAVEFDGLVNVNPHNRMAMTTNAPERQEPTDEDGHFFRPYVDFSLGGAF